jgi:hypothetical protein
MPTKNPPNNFLSALTQDRTSTFFNGVLTYCTFFYCVKSLEKIVIISLSIALLNCGQLPVKDSGQETSNANISDIFHRDSTVNFANKKASASLRASFIQKNTEISSVTGSAVSQSLHNGYKLQFRTILAGSNIIDRASIIAGGKRIPLTETELFVRPNKGLIISISEADTLFIHQQRDATLRFLFNGTSHLMSIRNHQLSEFILPDTTAR